MTTELNIDTLPKQPCWRCAAWARPRVVRHLRACCSPCRRTTNADASGTARLFAARMAIAFTTSQAGSLILTTPKILKGQTCSYGRNWTKRKRSYAIHRLVNPSNKPWGNTKRAWNGVSVNWFVRIFALFPHRHRGGFRAVSFFREIYAREYSGPGYLKLIRALSAFL